MPEIVPKDEDSINAANAMAIVSSIGTAFQQTAASQADAARAQADASVRVAELQHQNDRLQTHYAFALRFLGGLAIGGVIIGGFMSGRYELVTHALAGVGGLFAGYGLARAAR